MSDSQILHGLWALLIGPELTTSKVHADKWTYFELVEEKRKIDIVSDSQILHGLWNLLIGPELTTSRVHADKWNT